MSQKNNYDYDSPDLWARMKLTRDSVSSASISNKYRSPGYRPSQRRCAENNSNTSPLRNPVSPSQADTMQATVIRSTNSTAVTVTCKAHKAIATAIPKCFKAPEPVVATSRSPLHENKPPSSPKISSKITVKLPEPVSRLCDSSHVSPSTSIPSPYIPPHIRPYQYQNPDQRILPRHKGGQGTEQKNWRNTARPSHPPLISHAAKAPQRSTNKGKMSSSGDSDYVVLRNPRAETSQPQNQDASGQTGIEAGGGTPLGGSIHQPAREPSEEKQPTTRAELRAEIKRLQKEELAKIYQNLYKEEVETADAEVVAKCRDGPGVDPKSEVYKEIEAYRRVRPMEEVDLNVEALSIVNDLDDKPEDDRLDNLEQIRNGFIDGDRLAPLWDAYERQSFIYPNVINDQVTLSPKPTEAQTTLQAKFQRPEAHPYASRGKPPTFPPSAYQKWRKYDHLCDWWWAPPMLPFYDLWLQKFRSWLDETIQDAYYADIYHKGYFDGTAHPDGVRTFIVPNLPKDTTILNPNDELAHRHRHETAAGLSYNYVMHKKAEAELEEQRLALARRMQLECMATLPPNPNTPRANIYLRPAHVRDANQLLPIYNWYAQNSFVSVDIGKLEPGDVRQRIQAAKDARLPFIVAVERGSGNQRENIFGYATAKDYTGSETSGRYTAELELFVIPEQQRKGIGNCLMDKLLQVCDGNHRTKGGYDFYNHGLVGYSLGGRREFARLIFTFTYIPEERQSKSWVRDWLAKNNFELQGRLCGVRAKNERLLDVAYFVKNNIFALPYR
ncbi:hypothetical protein BO79DRAFT_269311 [Aspergillus costaricaensis CBS 115574]|uniref:Uncharacterized protein n=1 Tax=Aspergillus costaricaensis CBS 115574 TaxID=1448317 RepID=A0ACD1IA32_9EURO|nr:hypothetical protein BO79DRAFT_269311 [Aspergillus costaricaensis CBS 115574]RAK87452.1 hypothetical protein BO79DRAFT_269311 [Aspergillus costaricaensis CBS 115574]